MKERPNFASAKDWLLLLVLVAAEEVAETQKKRRRGQSVGLRLVEGWEEQMMPIETAEVAAVESATRVVAVVAAEEPTGKKGMVEGQEL